MAKRERNRDLVGRYCRLAKDIDTTSGRKYLAGTVCRVGGTHRGRFTLDNPIKRDAGQGAVIVETWIQHAHRGLFIVIDPFPDDALSRLKAWIRDYGTHSQRIFVEDLLAVIDAVETYGKERKG